MSLLTCGICGLSFEALPKHLTTHKITWDEYIRKFPDATACTTDVNSRRAISVSKSVTGVPKMEEHIQSIQEANRIAHEQKKGDPIEYAKYKRQRRSIFTDEVLKSMSESKKANWQDPEYRHNQIAAVKKGRSSPTACRGGPEWTDEERLERSRITRENWRNNSEFQKKQAKLFIRRQRESELAFQELLDTFFPGLWKFVGNGELVIEGKCPDFVDTLTGKRLIEFQNGNKREYEVQLRKLHFETNGYDVLYIWAKHMKTPEGFCKVIDELVNYSELITI